MMEELTSATWVSLGINVLLALLGFLGRKAYVAMEERMAAQIISIEEVRKKMHLIEVELPKTYATKAELLQSRQETNEILKEMQQDLKHVLVAVGATKRSA